MDTSERWDSSSDLKVAVRVIFYLVFSAAAVYLLAFVVLIFVPGLANKLRSVGVDDAVLSKVFYPLLRLVL